MTAHFKEGHAALFSALLICAVSFAFSHAQIQTCAFRSKLQFSKQTPKAPGLGIASDIQLPTTGSAISFS